MILLDASVVSEPLRPAPNARVIAWLDPQAGCTIGTADALIAAIARTHGLIVATRDTGVFAAAGVRIVNPWEARTTR